MGNIIDKLFPEEKGYGYNFPPSHMKRWEEVDDNIVTLLITTLSVTSGKLLFLEPHYQFCPNWSVKNKNPYIRSIEGKYNNVYSIDIFINESFTYKVTQKSKKKELTLTDYESRLVISEWLNTILYNYKDVPIYVDYARIYVNLLAPELNIPEISYYLTRIWTMVLNDEVNKKYKLNWSLIEDKLSLHSIEGPEVKYIFSQQGSFCIDRKIKSLIWFHVSDKHNSDIKEAQELLSKSLNEMKI